MPPSSRSRSPRAINRSITPDDQLRSWIRSRRNWPRRTRQCRNEGGAMTSRAAGIGTPARCSTSRRRKRTSSRRDAIWRRSRSSSRGTSPSTARCQPVIPAARKRAVVDQCSRRPPGLPHRRQAARAPGGSRSARAAPGDRCRLPEPADGSREGHPRRGRDRGADSGRSRRGAAAGARGATGREVQLETRVNPSIVGGAIARIGSTVYNGSVMRQLEKMKRR